MVTFAVIQRVALVIQRQRGYLYILPHVHGRDRRYVNSVRPSVNNTRQSVKTLEWFLPGRRHASAGICRHRVCLSVSVSLTRRYCIKMAERRMTQSTPSFLTPTVAQSDPPTFLTPQFRPISPHSTSTVHGTWRKKFN